MTCVYIFPGIGIYLFSTYQIKKNQMFSTEQFPNPLDCVIEINLVFLKADHFHCGVQLTGSLKLESLKGHKDLKLLQSMNLSNGFYFQLLPKEDFIHFFHEYFFMAYWVKMLCIPASGYTEMSKARSWSLRSYCVVRELTTFDIYTSVAENSLNRHSF